MFFLSKTCHWIKFERKSRVHGHIRSTGQERSAHAQEPPTTESLLGRLSGTTRLRNWTTPSTVSSPDMPRTQLFCFRSCCTVLTAQSQGEPERAPQRQRGVVEGACLRADQELQIQPQPWFTGASSLEPDPPRAQTDAIMTRDARFSSKGHKCI